MEESTKAGCRPCGSKIEQKSSGWHFGMLPGLLLIVLPKCPFCFMAFSSTMLLCGEAGVISTSERIHSSSTTIILSALLCSIAILGIAMVKRDNRTQYALLIALAGTFMVMMSVMKAGGMPLYYAGTAVLFMAVWLNGSLLSVLRQTGLLPPKKFIKMS